MPFPVHDFRVSRANYGRKTPEILVECESSELENGTSTSKTANSKEFTP